MASLVSAPRLILRLCIIFLGIFNAYISWNLKHPTNGHVRHYSYINDDFPSTLDVPGVEKEVILVFQNTVRYQLNGTEADEEWKRLLPVQARLVRLGPHFRPFAVSMLHTLHCLDRLRETILNRPNTPVGRLHVEHCANYIRESILCAADIQLEPEDDPFVPRVCRDWTAVYSEVLNNHDAFINSNIIVPY